MRLIVQAAQDRKDVDDSIVGEVIVQITKQRQANIIIKTGCLQLPR
jgi:hypothetical protein